MSTRTRPFDRSTLAWPLAVLLGATVLAQSAIQYPATRKVDHVDTYHGTQVADPYRWLEDDTSAETAAWVRAQNAVTFAYLEQIPFRAALKARLETLYDYERFTAPTRRGSRFFFSKNDGLQNQSVLYVQRGLDGAPEVLLDPNTWSADGTTRLGLFSPSRDGRYAAYAVSRAGSDWQEFKVLDLETRKPMADTLEWIKVSGVAWHGHGFFYSRYPAPEKGKELSSANEHHTVHFHRIGTPQSEDVVVYRDPANPQRFHGVSTTRDERFAVLTISDAGRARRATRCSCATCPGATPPSPPSSRRSATTTSR
jgi:prolyl oligopeptidase